MSRRVAFLLTIGALVITALGLWLRFRPGGVEELIGELRLRHGDRLELAPARFADLPGWRQDRLAAALPAFLRSCERLTALPDDTPLGGAGFAGKVADWRPACAAAAKMAAKVPAGNSAAARAFFERWFRPAAVTRGGDPLGLFTGYYEPLLHGSRKRGARYTVPLYMRPPELVMVDLGKFRDSLQGQRIAGKVVNGNLLPYPDRAAIDKGALAGRKLELVWVDDPVDAFFLAVQGSGRIELVEGGELRVGYAAQNGHPYFAIGKDLIERGALRPEEVSLQSIRRWLAAHPKEAAAVLHRNPSYVFFQKIQGEGPLGAQGVVLTPGRSLAVDLAQIPLGVPLWLSAGMPGPHEGDPDRKLRRLLIAQDTGGAIQGPVRGDVFWGHSPEAAEIAGRMKHRGRLWVLLPKREGTAANAPKARAGRRRPAPPRPG
jgi:membrane-bound lytic murein transglycosylase A